MWAGSGAVMARVIDSDFPWPRVPRPGPGCIDTTSREKNAASRNVDVADVVRT